jgi:hypothetical protein
MSPIAEIITALGTIAAVLVPMLIGFGRLEKGQSDQAQETRQLRADFAVLRTSVETQSKDSAVLAERFAALAASSDKVMADNGIEMDEIKGELKAHGRQIHSLELWRAEVKGRT